MAQKKIPAGSVYPNHRLGPSGPVLDGDLLVRLGYDAVVESLTIPSFSLAPLTIIPRNLAADPLEVVFPDFAAGDILEIDCRFSGQTVETAGLLNAVALVSLDGGTKFYVAAPSSGPQDIAASSGATTIFWAGVITDPMPIFGLGGPLPSVALTAPPIVRILNLTDENLNVGGLDDPFSCGSVWLKCIEYLGGKKGVFQAPPGVLFDLLL